MTEPMKLAATLGSLERAGRWTVPPVVQVQVRFGNAELDLRDAELEPGTTAMHVDVAMGNVELIVPAELEVELNVKSVAANVEQVDVTEPAIDASRGRLVITGVVKFGNFEVVRLRRGESRGDNHEQLRRERHRKRHARRHKRWADIRAERELWKRHRHHGAQWVPWWLLARMRRRIFSWLTLAVCAGAYVGYRLDSHPKWWHVAIGLVVLSVASGGIAWRMTRPLIMVVRAARDIGDGKLDTRLDTEHTGGEVRVLANAINDMAGKIQQQIADQRQLLAAVSHELRTPLGHMRVLIETARDTGDAKPLDDLEREVLVLDDLVGRLLASSRLEFGTLDRRALDLGELVTDAATSAGIAPEAIEAIGDVKARIDPTLVRRAIANLLDNARVHGGGAVAVRIERRGAQVAVEVDDAGPGVPADRRADSFRAFVPSSGGGLGLGLALVSRIAVAHGGGAWIADRPGGGARVGFAVSIG